jgi:two-component system, NtrC family, response regulator HydG
MTDQDPFDDASTKLSASVERPTAAAAAFDLVIVEGPDGGARHRVDGARPQCVHVGTSPSCELRLRDPHVSRRHAALEVNGGVLRVVDLGSTNGTWANGVFVTEAHLRGGEALSFGGHTLLRVELVARDVSYPISSATSFGQLLGASVAMRRLYPLCERIAASDIPVLIEGETGTGKEVLAESIHEASARATEPFVVLDCTTVAPTLMEATLFGHERGAFTGAIEARRGVFEEASGGTLLIDEIGELELGLQSKLLRALDRSEIRRVGSTKPIVCDVRILAATRRDLEAEIAAGRFRDDLFFRLAVGRVELPPLRRRVGDVRLLARHFWTRLGGAGDPDPELVRRFEQYPWPGNVRELCNAVGARIALGDLALVDALRAGAGAAGSDVEVHTDLVEELLALELPFVRARERLVEAFRARYLEDALARAGGNIGRAAERAGLARRYFQLLRARQRGQKGG